MKSITIHNLDAELARSIEAEAEQSGASLNKTIQKLLRLSLGITSSAKEAKRKQLEEYYGMWSKEDAEEFDKNIADLEKIDAEDWK